MKITEAEFSDLQTILTLQYLAYQSEARLLNNFDIQPLKQALDEVREEYHKGKILKAVDEAGTIVGSVRGFAEDGTVYVNKLIVHPDCQGKGIGTQLLHEIEKALPSDRYELFTSSKSVRNLALYERLGYVRFREQKVSDELTFVYLEK